MRLPNRAMSAFGMKRTCTQPPMTAFGGKADISAVCRSVFWKYQSLFAGKISLFLILGNSPKNLDDPLEICSSNGFNIPPFAKFPVKFPVSREWRSETGPICTGSPASQSGLSIFRVPVRKKARK